MIQRGLSAGLAVAWLILLAGCNEQASHKYAVSPGAPATEPRVAMESRDLARRGFNPAQAQATAAAPDAQTSPADGRYIAYTHRYTVEAERAKLRAVLDAHLARCREIDCVVLSQTYTEENDNMPPSAALSVRVVLKDKTKFTDALKSGDSRVINQSSVAEDKTLQVVDIEARVTNLTQLRDRLRKLLTDPKAGIKETVEIERQLAQTQGQLDSMASQRRVLAQQTERELFEINYQAQRSAIERSILEPVKDALLSFGRVAMQSFAALISFIAAALVWIALLVVLGLVLRWWFRRRQKH